MTDNQNGYVRACVQKLHVLSRDAKIFSLQLDDNIPATDLTMKIAPLLLLVTPIHGFAPVVHRPQRVTFARKMTETSSSETTTSDFASAMPDAGDAYSRLGVEEEKVALGVDPNEILQWLGT